MEQQREPQRTRLNTTYIRPRDDGTMPGRELETGYRCYFLFTWGQLSKSSPARALPAFRTPREDNTPQEMLWRSEQDSKVSRRFFSDRAPQPTGSPADSLSGRASRGGGPRNPACGLAGPLTHSHRSSAPTLGLSFPIRAPQSWTKSVVFRFQGIITSNNFFP